MAKKRDLLTADKITNKFWLDADGNVSSDLDPERFTNYVLGLMNDKIKAQNARDVEVEKIETLEEEVTDLKEAGADKSKVDDRVKELTTQVKNLEKAAKEPTDRELRLEVAITKKLTVEQAERLRGTTLEELTEDAVKYKAEIGLTDDDEGGESGSGTGPEGGTPLTPARRPGQMNNGFSSDKDLDTKLPEIDWTSI
jgi:hypothetical protein